MMNYWWLRTNECLWMKRKSLIVVEKDGNFIDFFNYSQEELSANCCLHKNEIRA